MSTELKPIDTSAEFVAWPKIPRNVLGGMVITEKMDGTNACVIIEDGKIVGVQSRKRMINVGKESDNYGFASHVSQNEEKFLQLGEGRHYGEWTGLGINGNPHCLPIKEFYLFDVRRWGEHNPPPEGIKVVRTLYDGMVDLSIVDSTMVELAEYASKSGYKPEGVVVNYPKLGINEKYTFEYSKGKWTGVK